MYQLWKVIRRTPFAAYPRVVAGLGIWGIVAVFAINKAQDLAFNFAEYEEEHPGFRERQRQYAIRKNQELLQFFQNEKNAQEQSLRALADN